MNWKSYIIKLGKESRIAVEFEKNPDLIARFKKLEGAKWSSSTGVWHLPDTRAYRERFGMPQTIILDEAHNEKIKVFEEWLRSRRYSENTVKVYTDALKSFLLFCTGKPVEHIQESDVIRYNNEYILKNELSSSYQNQVVNAIKLFFRTQENCNLSPDLVHRPKREKTLPNVLSKEEIKMILCAPVNIKHRAMLSLIYSCGLRRGELLNLKPADIDAKRGIVIIRQSKGKKDRIVPFPDSFKEILAIHAHNTRDKGGEYLFERVINKLMHGATVAEAHFGFGRVDVHVYQRRINRQEQAAARLAATV